VPQADSQLIELLVRQIADRESELLSQVEGTVRRVLEPRVAVAPWAVCAAV
jgi:hypothetical protein